MMTLSGAEDEKNPFGQLIGLQFASWGDGESVCHLEVAPALLNPNGVLHGAVVYTMADTGMGGALVSALDAGQVCTTVEIKISYFRAVVAGTLRCHSRVIHRGKRIAFLEAMVYDEDALIAQATGTFAIR
ncbi:MAG: PaaI family thioesterase [Ardenticatenaceae bacterium]|nr:PaaI family thioesterase [Ardenticatenaceae bacterium]MBL1127851.1 PaaI family thioesterase [Chloroflexota bacterium]